MKSLDFNKLSTQDLQKLDNKQLKKLVSLEGQKSNKRYYRIKSNPELAQNAVNNVNKSGGRFSVKGKNTKAELLIEAKRIQRFNKSKTGSVSGARQSKLKYEKAYKGMTHKEVEKEETKRIVKEEKKKAQEEAKKKGKKLSKKKRKAIERKARKQAKQVAKKYAIEESENRENYAAKVNDEIDKLMCGIDEYMSPDTAAIGEDFDPLGLPDNLQTELEKNLEHEFV